MESLLFDHPAALAALALGYILLVVEFCIPGIGAPGILGAILAVLGIIALQPSPAQALVIVVVYVLLLLIALAICLRSAVRGRLSKSRLVNSAVATHAPAPENSGAQILTGKTGTALTPLRPAGIAEFDGARMNVVSAGDYIERGTKVRVIRAEGNRIVVEQIRN